MRRWLHIAAPALLLAGAAEADGVSGLIEQDYSHSRTWFSDGAGPRSDADQLVQRYRLALDRSFFPNLRLDAGGTFEQFLAQSRSGALSSDLSSRTGSIFANLGLSGPILGGSAGYSRREQSAGTATVPFGFVSEDMNLYLTWRPTDLPLFSLRLARPSLWDRQKQVEDLTTRQALFGMVWAPNLHLDLRYALDFQNPVDRLHKTDVSTITQSARAGYDDRLFDDRSAVALALNLVNQQAQVARSNAGGTTTTVLSPIAGVSLVEVPPALPTQDTLPSNAALINGDTQSTAGINLGPSASIAGDVAPRDLGIQFADAVTRANTLWVWVDRQLPQALAAALTWTAYRSDDNLSWVQVPIVGQPGFNAFQPRFEIAIQEQTARYLKLVAKPLPAGATLDPAFRDVLVTELQALLVTAAPAPHGWQSSTGATFNATARTQIVLSRLSHDVTLFVTTGTRAGAAAQNTWVLVNGLNLTQKLLPALLLNARVARQDSDQSRGHEGQWTWGGSLASSPLPTLTTSLVYSGKQDQTLEGDTTTHSLSIFEQVTPYRGIGLLANAGLGLAQLPSGQLSRLDTLAVSLTLQPHPRLTLASNFAHAASETTGAGLPRSASRSNQIDGTVTFTPVRALLVSAGISHVVASPAPVTLANGNVNFSPFQGGDLQLGVSYSQQLDADGAVSRIFSPSLRWNLRRATVTTSFTALDTEGSAADAHSRTFGVDLRIPL